MTCTLITSPSAIDPTVSEDTVRDFATGSVDKINFGLTELRRLFLIEDLVDSAKFGLSLWFLTYIGGCFNAMTLVVISWVGLFTLPKVRCRGNVVLTFCRRVNIFF